MGTSIDNKMGPRQAMLDEGPIPRHDYERKEAEILSSFQRGQSQRLDRDAAEVVQPSASLRISQQSMDDA